MGTSMVMNNIFGHYMYVIRDHLMLKKGTTPEKMTFLTPPRPRIFGGIAKTSYLCTVKRERPTPDPSRKGGERPPGSGNDLMTERSLTINHNTQSTLLFTI